LTLRLEVKMYKDFTETSFWNQAIEIASEVFFITNVLPRKEDYGLTSQLRRASVSISANIAEAFGRHSSADKSKFYDYARGSAFETKSLLLYGIKVNYFSEEETKKLIERIAGTIHEINKVKLTLNRKP
jgi:four helix bundle protein